MGELLALGISHKTAPLALRERLALPEGRAAHVMRELVSEPAVPEAAALSTCNRTELYLVGADAVEAESVALGALARQADLRPTELFGHLYALRGLDAVRHLFSVTAGLDSMVVGEAEIQGQVKRAYELALVEGASGPLTNRLFRDALAAGKRARTETAVARARVSIASVAVELARAALGELESRRVLVVGAGANADLTAEALVAAGVETVFVANRHHDRALALARRTGGQAVRFDALPAELARADIVVGSTSSPHQILGREELARVMAERQGRPLLVIDIAVPRDVEPSAREVPGVTVYDMDDLQRQVGRNVSGREAEATRARTLIEEEVDRFGSWLSSLEVLPTISALRERGETIVRQVLSENEPRWESLSRADRERVEMMARAIVRRLLHEPTLRMKREVEHPGSYAQVQALRQLFGLEGGAAALEDRPSAVPGADQAPAAAADARVAGTGGAGQPSAADVASLEERRAAPRRR